MFSLGSFKAKFTCSQVCNTKNYIVGKAIRSIFNSFAQFSWMSRFSAGPMTSLLFAQPEKAHRCRFQ